MILSDTAMKIPVAAEVIDLSSIKRLILSLTAMNDLRLLIFERSSFFLNCEISINIKMIVMMIIREFVRRPLRDLSVLAMYSMTLFVAKSAEKSSLGIWMP